MPPKNQHRDRSVGLLAKIAAGALSVTFCVAGCAVDRRPSFLGSASAVFLDPGEIVPISPRFDAVRGRALAIPVRYNPPPAEKPAADRVRVLMDDGTVLPATLHRVEVSPSPAPPSWLPDSGVWRSNQATRISENGLTTEASARSAWFLLLEVPESERPDRLRIGPSSVSVRWLDADPPPRPVSRPIVPDPRTSGVPSAALLAPEFSSPLRRWRGWLAARSVRFQPTEDAPKFGDPVLEAIAAQEDGRWLFALGRLAREDRVLLDRLVAVLSATADFGAGRIVPVWPTSEDDARALLADLIDPSLDSAARRARVEAWIHAQRSAVTWIEDDAGRPGGGPGKPVGTLGILNLGDKRELARIEVGDRTRDGREPVVADPGVVRRATIFADDSAPDAARRPVTVRVRVGETNSALPIALRKLAAEPPGLVLGPFFDDLTLESWSSGQAQLTSADDGETAAMVFRSLGGEWTLYLESNEKAPMLSESKPSVVRIWLGMSGQDRVIEIRSDGTSTARDRSGAPIQAEVVTTRSGGKWVAQVAIPSAAIEADGTLRVGIERVSSNSRRSAFPRPMLPWEEAPGRVAIDTTAW